MRTHFWTFILPLLLTTHTTSARPNRDLLKAYKKAKKYYADARYTAAQETLWPLITSAEQHELTPYALFYYALAAYRNQEPTLATATFRALATTCPDWEQREEVWYWLSQLSFEAEDYPTSMAYLNMLTAPAHTMKQHFIAKIQDLHQLQALWEQYPKDVHLAQALFDKAMQQPLIKRDIDLLQALAQHHGLDATAKDPLQELTSVRKDHYNVAILLPFFVDEVDYEEEDSPQFVIQLYQGIQAAAATLATQGIQINLFAYDTKKDPKTTTALLEHAELRHMDLIIGPLYPTTIPLVTDFAYTHKINVINPLSENADVVSTNPFIFLFRPSLETQARKAAEYTLQNTDDKINVGIVYSTAPADAIRAHTYQQKIEKATGKEVALALPIAPAEAQNFLKLLRDALEATEEEEEEKALEGHETPDQISLDSLTHIYIATKDELISANVLSAVEMLRIDPYIIGHEAWLQQGVLTLDHLRHLRLRLVAPDHIRYDQKPLHQFRRQFYDQFAQYPTHYACTGYEMMHFFGNMLAQHGTYFQKHWDATPQSSAIYSGIAYGTHHDNQQVPILQFRDNALAEVHQPSSASTP